MRWFRRKPKYPPVVSVNFRELHRDANLNPRGAYAYKWTLDYPPSVGLRVWVRGGDGRKAPAVIAVLGQAGIYPAEVPVLGVVTQDEMDAAFAKVREAEDAWLEMARKAAGFKSSSRKRKVPEGFPEIAPVDGDASPAEADEYGRIWWRAYRRAEERAFPDEEVKRLSSIAHRWFAIRDRG